MEATECPSHYWIIEIATGPESMGVCRCCQETRMFKNSFENPKEFLSIGRTWFSRSKDAETDA
jgi:hypothetical protein